MLETIKDYWFLIAFMIGLFSSGYQAIKTLNDTLKSILHQQEITNINHQHAVEESIKDRNELHEILAKHENTLEKHDVRIDNHEGRLIVLENQKVIYKETR